MYTLFFNGASLLNMDLYEKWTGNYFPNGRCQNTIVSGMKGRPEGRKFGLGFQPWQGFLLQLPVNHFRPDQKRS